jgi:superfamily I DNA and RNA helicase
VTIEYIPTRTDQANYPELATIVAELQQQSDNLRIDGGVLYYGWPKFQDYEAVGHRVDLALLSKRTGLFLIRHVPHATLRTISEADESISQAAATAEAQMLKSANLRGPRRKLKFDVVPIIYAPGYDPTGSEQSELVNSRPGLLTFIQEYDNQGLTADDLDEARSILEGAKALTRPVRRRVDEPHNKPAAAALARLEEEIAKFDAQQRYVALTTLQCPQRIRGLAGSGKTVILAMKAALAHIDNPEAKILVTYYTRSLKDHLTRSITRFHRHFAEGEPDWTKIDVQHGWGQRNLPGVYREASLRAGLAPITFGEARRYTNPFDHVCKTLVETGKVAPHYDLILIDEGQDFPEGFYRLCFFLAKGSRDQKQIIWAYDELQDVFDVRVRSAEDLFGVDEDGEPRISLRRAVPATADTNDFVLPKCYRNQRDVLVLAHAIGFGLYGEPVQMLQNEEHWKDVGYEVLRGTFVPGTDTIIRRPDRNSPTKLDTSNHRPLIEAHAFKSVQEEVDYCVSQFRAFIEAGLEPHDLLAIAIDDSGARYYLAGLAAALAELGIDTNNIIADRYSEPPFLIEGKVTLSTVYRAKGNEAAVVAVLGCDGVTLKSRTGRNRLFTAFTRTKGWLRLTGMRTGFAALHGEINKALELTPELRFIMPDPKQIETIQRDLAEKDARLQRARAQMDKVKDELGLTDEDLKTILNRSPRRPGGETERRGRSPRR